MTLVVLFKMKISGFTMMKNADKLYYPVRQMIMSVLPVVDEFIVALGDCDRDDNTREIIQTIDSNKIKIIDTVWNLEKYPRGMENAHQTDIAKNNCSGDWLFYMQADEVIHEKYLDIIVKRCNELYDDREIRGLLFRYRHFWGDYDHYHNSHSWYKNEIRIIRNDPDIHSWESAQSFRYIPDFDGINYRQQENTYKLKVAKVDAEVYHYGWVRPPHLMRNKSKALDTIHKGAKAVSGMKKHEDKSFDYGPLERLPVFKGTHPAVMKEWIEKFDWKDELQYSGKPGKNREPHKHEKFRYRLASFVENNLLCGATIGGFKNYILVNR